MQINNPTVPVASVIQSTTTAPASSPPGGKIANVLSNVANSPNVLPQNLQEIKYYPDSTWEDFPLSEYLINDCLDAFGGLHECNAVYIKLLQNIYGYTREMAQAELAQFAFPDDPTTRHTALNYVQDSELFRSPPVWAEIYRLRDVPAGYIGRSDGTLIPADEPMDYDGNNPAPSTRLQKPIAMDVDGPIDRNPDVVERVPGPSTKKSVNDATLLRNEFDKQIILIRNIKKIENKYEGMVNLRTGESINDFGMIQSNSMHAVYYVVSNHIHRRQGYPDPPTLSESRHFAKVVQMIKGPLRIAHGSLKGANLYGQARFANNYTVYEQLANGVSVASLRENMDRNEKFTETQNGYREGTIQMLRANNALDRFGKSAYTFDEVHVDLTSARMKSVTIVNRVTPEDRDIIPR
jgi:hypothetical protein